MLDKITTALQEIIYPRYCLICHKKIAAHNPKELICAECLEKIIPNIPPFCRRCGRHISAQGICDDCAKINFHFDRAWASCRYDGAAREMLHSFKYKTKTGLGRSLSQLLINFVKNYHLPVSACDYVIPVPLSPTKLREREFNQAAILAEELAKYFELKLLDNNLKRIRNTASQTELDKHKRWQNIQGVFGLKDPGALKEKTILLIDDVLTTGATASEAAKTLKNAGASSVFVLTVAN